MLRATLTALVHIQRFCLNDISFGGAETSSLTFSFTVTRYESLCEKGQYCVCFFSLINILYYLSIL